MKRNFYLQHPIMAMNDPRMKKLIDKERLKGSGAYWFIIENWRCCPNRARNWNICNRSA